MERETYFGTNIQPSSTILSIVLSSILFQMLHSPSLLPPPQNGAEYVENCLLLSIICRPRPCPRRHMVYTTEVEMVSVLEGFHCILFIELSLPYSKVYNASLVLPPYASRPPCLFSLSTKTIMGHCRLRPRYRLCA